MKKVRVSKTDFILIIVIAAILGIILLGTVIGLATKKAAPGKNLRNDDPEPTSREIENLNKHTDSPIAAYTGLGTIRCITAPDPENPEDAGTAVVITPWLSYPEDDTVFFEELARKRLIITSLFTNYFNAYTKVELLSRTEDKIKQDIMEQINEQMSLGKIEGIYFTDYIFLE
jgi:flagellar FliL protein